MRTIFYLAIVFGLFASSPLSAAREMKWIAILGWSHPEITAYVDLKSVRQDIDKGHAYGIVLYFRKHPIEIVVGNKPIVANSIARYIIIDCKNTVTAPIADFYFNTVGLPVNDNPITAIDYSNNSPIVSSISKEDAIYKTLCTSYI